MEFDSTLQSKGEPALEIIVEKDDAVSNGDAWRTTIDACLPVLDLIDTRRSIPYGIQQDNSTDWGGFAWNARDGIGRPNAKSNVGSSWGEKDKMESDEHLKVPKESDTWSNLP
ncbi:unnamed protein product [Miscanthus lutarioriparius]|uniref:Uncharacterized protein n=1 Tax=Miscanthus lutarioriparius TaxID=422564 RepID=A0A811PMW4_9POAL|nr:unnamed protein product [Miscanthus lutarioriparius]